MISLQTLGLNFLNWTLWIYLFLSSDIFSLIVSKLLGSKGIMGNQKLTELKLKPPKS